MIIVPHSPGTRRGCGRWRASPRGSSARRRSRACPSHGDSTIISPTIISENPLFKSTKTHCLRGEMQVFVWKSRVVWNCRWWDYSRIPKLILLEGGQQGVALQRLAAEPRVLSTRLYYTILYYTILYYTILYYTTLYYTIRYYAMRWMMYYDMITIL